MTELMTGKRALDPGELRKVDLSPGMFRKSRMADGYIKFIFRMQGAVDQPWRQAAFMESVWDQAKVMAKGDEKQTQRIIERSVKSFDDGLPDEIAVQAMIDAEEAVFQNKSIFGQWITTAKRAARTAAAPGGVRGNIAAVGGYSLEYVVPFSNTPGAIISRIIERTPFGFVGSIRGLRRLAQEVGGMSPDLARRLQRQYTKQFGRAAAGSMALGLGMILAHKGLMSGRWPTESGEQRKWMQAGKSEDSILIGGKWRKLSGISPLGNLLAVGAQIALDAGNPDYELTESLTFRPIVTALRTVKEQSFLRGVSEALEVLDKDTDTRYFPNQAGSFVPIAVKDFANVVDPRIRDVQTAWESVQSSVPYWSFQVDAKLDEFGRPLVREGSRWTRLIDPFNTRGIRDDALIRELDRVNATVPLVAKASEETHQQWRARRRVIGGEREKALRSMFAMPAYRRLSREQQAEAVSDVLRDVRRQAVERPLPSYRRFIGRALTNARRPRRR
jgi:hypothetical protein